MKLEAVRGTRSRLHSACGRSFSASMSAMTMSKRAFASSEPGGAGPSRSRARARARSGRWAARSSSIRASSVSSSVPAVARSSASSAACGLLADGHQEPGVGRGHVQRPLRPLQRLGEAGPRVLGAAGGGVQPGQHQQRVDVVGLRLQGLAAACARSRSMSPSAQATAPSRMRAPAARGAAAVSAAQRGRAPPRRPGPSAGRRASSR